MLWYPSVGKGSPAVVSNMKIEWAPLSVPLHRRLETLSAGSWIFIMLFGEIICLFIYLWCLVSARQPVQFLNLNQTLSFSVYWRFNPSLSDPSIYYVHDTGS